jgi:HlyD family secretion protein
MKKLALFIILLAGGGGGAWYYYTYGQPVEKPQVVQMAVSRGDIVEQVSATGQLEPLKRVDVGAQVSGVVKEMYVDYNHIVKQGQLLAEIDPTLLQVQVEIRKATIQRQEGDIANQEVQLEDVKRQLERTRELNAKGLANQQQLEQAELNVKTRTASIDSARKQLIQARADLTQAELNVSYTKIISPIDGVVVDRRVDRGQTVQASLNTPSFFILATPLQNLKLTAGVDEADVGKLRTGMEVTFTVDAYGQTQFRGVVDAVRLNASVQNNVVTYPVWINVPNPDLRLRPSMTANIKIIVNTAPNVVRVPLQATRFRPNADIYRALGLEPPQAGVTRMFGNGDPANNGGAREGGTGAGASRDGKGAPQPGKGTAQPGTGARPPQSPGGSGPQAAEAGRGGDRQNRQPGAGGQGFGGQRGMGDLTPEQLQAMRERFGRGGGGRGQGGGGRSGDLAATGTSGRGGQGGRSGRNQVPAGPPVVTQEGSRIDEYFVPIPRQNSRGSVWTWDEAKKELKQINITLGLGDGTFGELVQGDLQVGQQLVTNVIIPQARTTSPTGQNPLFGNQQRGGGPGGFGGGPGGNPGGGGGGGRGGGR